MTGLFNCTGTAAESHTPIYWGGGELGEGGLSLKDITLRYILTDKNRFSYKKTTDFLGRYSSLLR